jgi:hypothetical protein
LFPRCKPFHNLMVEPKLKAISNKHSCKQWFSICCCGQLFVEINKHPCYITWLVDIGLQRVPKMNCKACFKTSKKLMWNKVIFFANKNLVS